MIKFNLDQSESEQVNTKIFEEGYNLTVNVESVSGLIARTQKKSGDIPWHSSGITDPWDHIESAMGLSIGGRLNESANAFEWLRNMQMLDGSWYSSYENGTPKDKTRETNMSAYIAVGLFQYWLITTDYRFIKSMWDTLCKAINFVVDHQGPNGEIYWAISPEGKVDTTALLTASSSVFMSLKCAIALAYELGINVPRWEKALKKLKRAILYYKDSLFDSSKARFSMDWFYPILCGAISGNVAHERICHCWDTFVVEGLGVRCVSDRPWITIAESSELVLSLDAMGNSDLARTIFNWIAGRIFEDGSFWCGFTFPEIKIWPVEKITWNNAALLMATDVLHNLTPANNMFHHDWWKNKYSIS